MNVVGGYLEHSKKEILANDTTANKLKEINIVNTLTASKSTQTSRGLDLTYK